MYLRKKHLAASLAIFAAGAFSTLSAHASSSSQGSVTIKDFSYQLIDLDSGDNITPTFELLYTLDRATSSEWGGGSETRDSPGLTSVSSVNGAAETLSTSAAWSSSALSRTPWRTFQASTYRYLKFTLSARTAILFSATAQFDADRTGDIDADTDLLAQMYGRTYADGSTMQHSWFDDSYTYSDIKEVTGSYRLRGMLHSDDLEVDGHISLVTDSKTKLTFLPGIPEPETYAMLLAGLGLIGLMSRRKRSGIVT